MTVKDEEQLPAFVGGTVMIVGVARCKATGCYYFCILFIGIYCGINHTNSQQNEKELIAFSLFEHNVKFVQITRF